MWNQYIVIAFLGICAVFDWRMRRIPVWVLVVCGGLALAAAFGTGCLFRLDTLGAVLFGCIFLALARWKKDSIGEGDGWMIIICGLCMGVSWVVELCLLAFLGAGMVSFWLLVRKKGNRKTTFAFAPFLFAACAILFFAQEAGWMEMWR